mgnify:CR=1 FL=1
MKKTNIILSFVICILLYGCTDLSETVYTGVAVSYTHLTLPTKLEV